MILNTENFKEEGMCELKFEELAGFRQIKK